MATRTARQKNQMPPCYYEGFLEKRSFKDKTSRKLWTCLCGKTLFFFNDKKDTDYIETLDLSGLISVTDDSSPDRNLDAARLNLQMKDGNIKITVPSAEARELWKGFIHSVTKMVVPSSLNLLPGQIHMLKEAVDQEKERMKVTHPPAAPSTDLDASPQADMPACYHNVSRLEAMLLLERESQKGNLLLRPGSSGESFAVTTRQDLDGSIFKHYRVTRKHDGSFSIDVENPVPCATLHDVITVLVEKTEGMLVPLIFEEAYDKRISFVRSDHENGEKSVQQAPTNPATPAVPLKPVSLRLPAPDAERVSLEDEPLYLNDTRFQERTKEVSASLQPRESGAQGRPAGTSVLTDLPSLLMPTVADKISKKKAMIPPTPAPRKVAAAASLNSSSSSTSSSANNMDARMKGNPENLGKIPMATISELKLRLERKTRFQD